MRRLFERTLGIGLRGTLLSIVFSLGLLGESPEPVVEFSFQTYFVDEAFEHAALPELYYQRGDRFLPLNLMPHALGLRHVYKSSPPFSFFVQERNEAGELVYRRFATLNQTFAANNPGHQLVLVKSDSGRLHINSISVGREKREAREVLVLNAGSEDVAIRIGDMDSIRINRQSARFIDYSIDSNHQFRLMVASENGEGGWRLIHNAVVTQVRERPLLLVVYPHGATRSYNVRFLPLDI